MPTSGTIEKVGKPTIGHVRFENGYADGNKVTVSFDPMLAKLAAWGQTREEAVRTLHAPARHISELAWSPRGDAIACVSWQAPPLEFSLHDNLFERVPLEGGAAQQLCTFPGHASSLLWASDGESLRR